MSEWDKLPAPTYTTGFAKSYASAVGLDRAEIGEQLRAEMGGLRTIPAAEVFEPADPARTMPRSLVIGAIIAIIVLVVLMSWLNRRALEQPREATANAPAAPVVAAPVQAPAPRPAPAPVAQGGVVLNATEPVWLQITEKGGATLFSGTLQAGQTFAVPPAAPAPLLKTGKPEALRITVGNAVAPPVGPPATTVRDVSLLPADLMKGGQPAASAAAASNRSQPQGAPPAAAPAGAATNTGE